MFIIEDELKKLPQKPGVYIMHDAHDAIIYVGKAKVLKNRVRQYFQDPERLMPKIRKMVPQIKWFEYIVVDSEMEALVLECNLIKEHRPKYNAMLKDDKMYPYIKCTISEDFPRVFITRRYQRDKEKYFGPYTNAGACRETMELLRKLYKIRNCSRVIKEGEKTKPCLYKHIGQCDAPCNAEITKEEYGKIIDEVLHFLNGDTDTVIKDLRKKMTEASEKMDALFEEWKAVGYSGRDDEALWKEFSAVRKEFQIKKREHHQELLKTFEERAEKKEAMIKEAKRILADSDFSPEEVQKVKALRGEFNRIGFAGKEKDEELYQRFDEVIKKYFEEKKFYTF